MASKNAIYLKSDEEIEQMRESSILVSRVLEEIAKVIRPGINGLFLNKMAEDFIRSNNATPSFLNYRGFPFSLCISVNNAVVHGFPTEVDYKDGDIVSVDCGVFYNGFHGDTAYTYAIGDVSESTMKLMSVTKKSLDLGVAKAVVGNRTGDIGHAIQEYCESNRYGVVRELVGHGLGRSLHEEPDVPNFGKRGSGVLLRENLVIAIEPMINAGKKDVFQGKDGWTIFTKDGKMSAHFEHTLCIKKDKADVLTDHSIVEAAIAKNINLKSVA
jgi:methionyl aminopeptidase